MPNDMLYRDSEVPLEMFFIIAGIVELYVTQNDTEKTIRRLSDGDHFGAKNFLNSNPIRDSNARTETYTWLMCLSKKSLGQVVSENLLFSNEIAELLHQENNDGEEEKTTSLQNEGHESSGVILKLSKSHRKILIREKLRRRALALKAAAAFFEASARSKKKSK